MGHTLISIHALHRRVYIYTVDMQCCGIGLWYIANSFSVCLFRQCRLLLVIPAFGPHSWHIRIHIDGGAAKSLGLYVAYSFTVRSVFFHVATNVRKTTAPISCGLFVTSPYRLGRCKINIMRQQWTILHFRIHSVNGGRQGGAVVYLPRIAHDHLRGWCASGMN